MNILITGGTGLIGRPLTQFLRNRGHIVRILTRSKKHDPHSYHWDLATGVIDDAVFEDLDCIIHLAGASVSKRWTDSYREELRSSRVDTAALLHQYCIKHEVKLKSFISASGINYYGTFTSDRPLKEHSGILKHDFLADLCVDWENAAKQFSDIAARVVMLRTGLVLAAEGGAYEPLAKLTDFNLAAAVGNGKQWMSWIHLDDMARLYAEAVENPGLNGIYNAVADEPVTNHVFMKELASSRGKFFLPVPVPSFVLKIIFGEMSSILLEGAPIDNAKIRSTGFRFGYKTIQEAFASLR